MIEAELREAGAIDENGYPTEVIAKEIRDNVFKSEEIDYLINNIEMY